MPHRASCASSFSQASCLSVRWWDANCLWAWEVLVRSLRKREYVRTMNEVIKIWLLHLGFLLCILICAIVLWLIIQITPYNLGG